MTVAGIGKWAMEMAMEMAMEIKMAMGDRRRESHAPMVK